MQKDYETDLEMQKAELYDIVHKIESVLRGNFNPEWFSTQPITGEEGLHLKSSEIPYVDMVTGVNWKSGIRVMWSRSEGMVTELVNFSTRGRAAILQIFQARVDREGSEFKPIYGFLFRAESD